MSSLPTTSTIPTMPTTNPLAASDGAYAQASQTSGAPQRTANNPPDSQPNTQLSRWQRLRQYQPSNLLVKWLFGCWLAMAFFIAVQMSDGFGSAALGFMSNHQGGVLTLIGLAVLILILVAGVDLLLLISLSQAHHFCLRRQHPSNVPVLHQFDIAVYLSFNGAARLDNASSPNNTNSPNNIGANAAPKPTIAETFFNLLQTSRLVSRVSVDFYDDYPDQLAPVIATEGDAMPMRVVIPIAPVSSTKPVSTPKKKQTLKISYPVIATHRGTGYFADAAIRVWSPLKLFKRQFHLADQQQQHTYLRVLADFSGLLNNQLSAVFAHSTRMGLQSLLQQGNSSDFLKLREYSAGDAIRQIDWKASSRQRRLMSKSYEEDNDQDVIFLLDCGEQMRHYDSDDSNEPHKATDARLAAQPLYQASYFDKVLNAVLLLAYVANKQSDRVGLMTFAGEALYVAPKKGASLIRNLLNETADLQPSMLTSDYVSAAQALLKRVTKRSLVVVITNTRTEASEALTQALQLLAKRHQVVFANLTEQVVYDHLYGDVPPTDFDDVLLYHALNNYQQNRSRLHKNLSQQTGALCLQTTANKLPLTLTQAYLSLKNS